MRGGVNAPYIALQLLHIVILAHQGVSVTARAICHFSARILRLLAVFDRVYSLGVIIALIAVKILPCFSTLGQNIFGEVCYTVWNKIEYFFLENKAPRMR